MPQATMGEGVRTFTGSGKQVTKTFPLAPGAGSARNKTQGKI